MKSWDKQRPATRILFIAIIAVSSLGYVLQSRPLDFGFVEVVAVKQNNNTLYIDTITINQTQSKELNFLKSDNELVRISQAVDAEYFDTCDTVPTYLNSSNDTRHNLRSNISKHTVITWEGIKGMNEIISRGWSGNLVCEKIDDARSAAQDSNLPITVNITFGCKELYYHSGMGTGNFFVYIYGFRLLAHVIGNIDLYITCNDAEETKEELIIPWLTGWFPARPISQKSNIPLTVQDVCTNFSSFPIAYMYNEIKYDFRRMAIALMGVPSLSHPSAKFAEETLWSNDYKNGSKARSPLGACHMLPAPARDDRAPFPTSEYSVDDAVLHFRCGDLMDSNHPSFGFMKFSGYTRRISPDAKSIGIVTQPFDVDAQSRQADTAQLRRNRCRAVVMSLVEYIKVHFPNAVVNVRNDSNETIALTFARMTMANQTIAGISTFGVMPVLSTFGTGYIRLPDYPRAPNQWLLQPRIDSFANNVILFNESKRIMVADMKKLWQTKGQTGVLEWFWNDSVM
jgi:hypothetical protein